MCNFALGADIADLHSTLMEGGGSDIRKETNGGGGGEGGPPGGGGGGDPCALGPHIAVPTRGTGLGAW